ncbi:hypothetical protein GCM10009602_51330 [Nocardiopsis tropica]
MRRPDTAAERHGSSCGSGDECVEVREHGSGADARDTRDREPDHPAVPGPGRAAPVNAARGRSHPAHAENRPRPARWRGAVLVTVRGRAAPGADTPPGPQPPPSPRSARGPGALGHAGAADLHGRHRIGRPVTARPMMSRWISLAPSKIVKIDASRCHRSTG